MYRLYNPRTRDNRMSTGALPSQPQFEVREKTVHCSSDEFLRVTRLPVVHLTRKPVATVPHKGDQQQEENPG